MATQAELLEAIRVLEARIARKNGRMFALDQVLFGPQLDFVSDPVQFGTASCSRRAGKSVGSGAWLLEGPIKNPKAPSLYITLTRGSGKRIIWPTLLDLNRKHSLGYEPHESDLVLKRNGQGAVFLIGVDNKAEIEKARGIGWGRVVIDEAQTLPAYIQELVEDVLMPSLADHNGQVRMIGTPAPVPVGYFYESTRGKAWSHHSWTVWDNPHIENARSMLDKVLAVRGVTEDDPSIRREWFGEWAYDPNALVFRWDAKKNAFVELPAMPIPWQHVIGVDLGFDDSDAIAVIAFNDRSPNAYLVEEHVQAKAGVTTLANKLKSLSEKYDPLSIVVDTGGLGKKIAHEVTVRTGIPLKAAEKDRKFEFIELLNDAMRTGRFFAKGNSRFAHDALLVEWDRSTPDRLKVSDRFHSDIADAALYAFRESLHWLHVPDEVPVERGTPEFYQREVDEMEQLAEVRFRQQQEEAGVVPQGLEDSSNWEGWAAA